MRSLTSCISRSLTLYNGSSLTPCISTSLTLYIMTSLPRSTKILLENFTWFPCIFCGRNSARLKNCSEMQLAHTFDASVDRRKFRECCTYRFSRCYIPFGNSYWITKRFLPWPQNCVLRTLLPLSFETERIVVEWALCKIEPVFIVTGLPCSLLITPTLISRNLTAIFPSFTTAPDLHFNLFATAPNLHFTLLQLRHMSLL